MIIIQCKIIVRIFFQTSTKKIKDNPNQYIKSYLLKTKEIVIWAFNNKNIK